MILLRLNTVRCNLERDRDTIAEIARCRRKSRAVRWKDSRRWVKTREKEAREFEVAPYRSHLLPVLKLRNQAGKTHLSDDCSVALSLIGDDREGRTRRNPRVIVAQICMYVYVSTIHK